jgi:hypothetical protein
MEASTMARNALWRDLADLSAYERAVAREAGAAAEQSPERDLVATGSHATHIASDLVTPYVPMTADGRSEDLMWKSIGRVAATAAALDLDGERARHIASQEEIDLDDVVALVAAGEVVPEEMQEAFLAYDEAEYNPFLRNDPLPSGEWRDMGECSGCGAPGKIFAFHRTDLNDPFMTACGEYR